PRALAEGTGNLLANPSFEQDWINAKAEKQLISNWGEHGFGQQDFKPDVWRYRVPVKADERPIVWDNTTAHTGRYSIRMRPVEVKGRLTAPSTYQDILYAGYQGEPGKNVFDSARKMWSPKGIPLAADDAQRFFRKVRVSAWCRAESVPKGARIDVSFGGVVLSFPSGTYDWQRLEAEISGAALAEAFVKRLKGKKEGPFPGYRRITLRFIPAKGDPAGTVWFDDISAEEELPSTRNLAPNASFEETGKEGLPAEWSDQRKFLYVPPSWYYVWRDWSHFFSQPRGKVAIDDLIAHSGRKSFRFSVPPGDEKYCESGPIRIDQVAVRTLEIGVWLKADRIRYFDIRAVDERGINLNGQSFITGTRDRERAGGYRGTFGWRYFRKFFISDHPVKTVRVRLCARGFNGLAIDDVGKKATNNQVGTLWWDDLFVTDPLARSAETPFKGPPRPEIHVSDIDFGERLYGENVAFLAVHNGNDAACRAQAQMTLTEPDDEAGGGPAGLESTVVTIPAGETAHVLMPYEIWKVCPDWRFQYGMRIKLSVDGRPAGTTEIEFGTRPEIGRVEVERVYAHPDEAGDQSVWVNFGVTDTTLSKVGTLRYDFVRRGTGKVVKSIKVKKFQDVFHEFRGSQPLMNWWVDEGHLFLRSFDMSFLPAHDEDRPVRDHTISVVALTSGLFGREMFRCESVPFGLVRPNTEKLDPVRTVEVKNGATHVNGKPFFLRSCLGHWWRNEPTPSQRKTWAVTTTGKDKKKTYDFSPVKAHGFNSFWPNTPYELEYADGIWKANLYTGVWYPKGWRGLAFDDRYGAQWQCKSPAAEFQAAAKHPSLFLISLTAWEGGMPHTVYMDPKLLKAQAEFANEIRRLTKRPLFFSGGYSAHKQQYGTMWDVFGPESNWDGPSRVNVTSLSTMRGLGRDVSGMDFPNIFNDMAYDLIRF
ncbi:MAG: hypothetical protein QF473_34240, partial [Planctomycetota bacterium]|nr:hypothetical protein [Planctomycetota bacterium]